MSDDEHNDAATESAADGGRWSEDWLATIIGLAILALALLGLIPQTILW
jgi:hypothetical protein